MAKLFVIGINKNIVAIIKPIKYNNKYMGLRLFLALILNHTHGINNTKIFIT